MLYRMRNQFEIRGAVRGFVCYISMILYFQNGQCEMRAPVILIIMPASVSKITYFLILTRLRRQPLGPHFLFSVSLERENCPRQSQGYPCCAGSRRGGHEAKR